MVFVYRNYPYAPKATAFSGFMSAFAVIALVIAIAQVTMIGESPLHIIPTIICGAAAYFLYFELGRKKADKMAEKETDINIRTKANYALMYCRQNPEAYDQLIQENADFAAKYEKNEEGKIVKIKKK
ncbi:MAG: hypothetical protein IJ071_00595 [Ruminococcus sp.]|nr:hypothetical protein [Ruminococcus sp.]